MDRTEGDPWVPSEVVGVVAAAAAVAAAVFVETVEELGVVVAAEAVVAAAVAVAAPQGSASYVGAYDPGGTGHS